MGFIMDMFEYWHDFPPTHELVRAYLGYEPKEKPTNEPSTPEDIVALASLHGGRVLHVSCLPTWMQENLQKIKDEINQKNAG